MVTLGLIGLVGGLIAGISPCILPVLPVIFMSSGASRTSDSGRDATPYLVVAGLAISFSIFTLLGTLILGALPIPADTIRWVGLVLLVLLGIGMIVPPVERLLERPFARLQSRGVASGRRGFVLGLALGTVYVPCAGPVLAAITVAGATGKIGGSTVVLTLAFAVGTSLPLLVFALAGRRVAERVQAFRTRQRGVRIVAGVVVIGLAVALTFNLTDVIQRAVPDYTTALDNVAASPQKVSAALNSPKPAALAACAQDTGSTLERCGGSPAISGDSGWFNTPGDKPLTAASLKGKVVLVDFWAYSCINCQRAIKHVEAWYSRYKADGLVVIGVHTPEYAFEHVPSNVAAGAKRLGITYPVAIDSDYATWNRFANDSWPAEYLVDATGEIRHVAIGEGDYGGTEKLIRSLLTAAHPGAKLPESTDVPDTTPAGYDQTPETYLGAERAQGYAGTPLSNGTKTFAFPKTIAADTFALDGTWKVGQEDLTSGADAQLGLSFTASKVYLDVGGTGTVTATVGGKTTSYDVKGAPDIYTVVDLKRPASGVIVLKLSPGLQAYSFTFG